MLRQAMTVLTTNNRKLVGQTSKMDNDVAGAGAIASAGQSTATPNGRPPPCRSKSLTRHRSLFAQPNAEVTARSITCGVAQTVCCQCAEIRYIRRKSAKNRRARAILEL
jgi:hypothetical protein